MSRLMSLWIACIALSGSVRGADQHLYLAAGDALTVFSIHVESGKLDVVQTLSLPGAGAFTFSYDDSKMYAICGERTAPKMATLERKADGTLALLNSESINYFSGHLKVDKTGGYIAGHNNREGKAMLWKLDGGIYQGDKGKVLDLEPKAHCAVFSPDNRWLLVPATAPNKVFVNAFDAKAGTLSPNNPPFSSGPQGDDQARQPRHLIFHPTLSDIVYTTNEQQNPGVCVWQWNGEEGTLKPIQDIVTTPDNLEGRLTVSTLHLTPDHRFLYAANRNLINRKTLEGNSSIVGFRVNSENGQLTKIGHTPCENVPRTFCIDQTGRYIYVPGQHDQKLGVYEINQTTGELKKVEQQSIGKASAWIDAR